MIIKAIKGAMKLQGLTQVAISEMLDINPTNISLFLNRKQGISFENLEKIFEFLQIRLIYGKTIRQREQEQDEELRYVLTDYIESCVRQGYGDDRDNNISMFMRENNLRVSEATKVAMMYDTIMEDLYGRI